MRRIIIGSIVIIASGLISSHTILSHRGILPPSWDIMIEAIIAGGTFGLGTLFDFSAIGPSRLSKGKTILFYAIAVIVDIVLILVSFTIPVPSPPPPPLATAYCTNDGQSGLALTKGIGITQTKDGQFIGISDGSFAFDAGIGHNERPDTPEKCQAAEQIAHKDIQGAKKSLADALKKEPNDAEEQIYQENLNVLSSHMPYVTVVVATMLTGNDLGRIGVGRDTLQGVYTAQREYNTSNTLPNNLSVRVLIANADSNADTISDNVSQVTKQIINLSKVDPTFIGVVGWNFSSYAKIEIPLLNKANIPMILPTASEDTLLTNSPYAFRITPTSKKQAIIAASYINTYLHSKHVLLLYDDTDPFSGPLAQDFKRAYMSYGNSTISEEKYRVGNRSSLQGKLDDLLIQDNHPDLIYFAGYPADLITLLNNSSITNPLAPNYYTSLKIVGGDSLYEVNDPYPSGIYKHLLFTAAASPDVWQRETLPAPTFFSDYGANFDPTGKFSGTYGLGRADADAILNYDALLALLNGYTKVPQITSTSTLQAIKQGLDAISGFQGASGWISLKDDNGENPDVNKVTVMLAADQDGHTQIQQVYGCLTPDHCY